MSVDNHILEIDAIAAVDSCYEAVSLWPSVIAASSEDTNALYYAGSIMGKAVIVHETSEGVKQVLYEDANYDGLIHFDENIAIEEYRRVAKWPLKDESDY